MPSVAPKLSALLLALGATVALDGGALYTAVSGSGAVDPGAGTTTGAASDMRTQAVDSMPAARLVREALAALGADSLLAVPAVAFDELSVQSWPGQGPSTTESSRSRVVRRRVSASRGPAALLWRYEQETADGDVEWCLESRADERGLRHRDCVSGVVTATAAPIGDPIATSLRGFPHGRVAALLERLEPGAFATLTRSERGEAWRLEAPDVQGGTSVWLFARDSWLPLRVDFAAADELGRPARASDHFDEYRDVGPGVLPGRIERRRPDTAPSEMLRVAHVRFEIDEPGREPSIEVPVVGASMRDPSVDTLAPAVWQIGNVVPGANAMLVRTDAGVVQIEAPGGAGGQRTLDELTARLAPGAPLAAVVVTHFHHDHLSGLIALGTREVPVYLPGSALAYVRALLGDAGARLDLRAAAGVRIGSGSARLDLHEIDGMPHVDRLVLPVLAEPRVVFVSDLFFLEPSGHVRPAGPETRRLASAVRDLGFVPALFASGHAGAFRPLDLEQSVLMGTQRAPEPIAR